MRKTDISADITINDIDKLVYQLQAALTRQWPGERAMVPPNYSGQFNLQFTYRNGELVRLDSSEDYPGDFDAWKK